MKNITPTVEPTKVSEETIKAIDDLNEHSSNGLGRWIHDERLGTVWQLQGDQMDDVKVPPNPPTPPVLLEKLVKWGKSYDFDNLPKNAVVLIKLDVRDPMRVQMMQRAIANQVLEPRRETLKSKQICVLFMEAGDNIEVMNEEDMKQAGWEKKDKKLIITLN